MVAGRNGEGVVEKTSCDILKKKLSKEGYLQNRRGSPRGTLQDPLHWKWDPPINITVQT